MNDKLKYAVMTKAEFAEKLRISPATRARYLNKLYFDEIKKLGYRKESKTLSPEVVRWLIVKLVYIP